jgi:hypothetical protein
MVKIIRNVCVAATLFLLVGCLDSAPQFVPEALLQSLQGKWVQVDGTAKLTFYDDETVKVIMPDHKPPLKLLTHLEVIKGDVVLNLGDRWERPILLAYDDTEDRLDLGFVADDGETVNHVYFVRLIQ